MTLSAYHVISKEIKFTFLDTVEFLGTHTCINNQHWESSEIIIFLCKYHINVSDTLIGSLIDLNVLDTLIDFVLASVVLAMILHKLKRAINVLQKSLIKTKTYELVVGNCGSSTYC